jgi:hypothetical protein
MTMQILNSASKIVFILVTLAVIGLTFLKIIEAKDFFVLASMVFAFYFSKPASDSGLPGSSK